MIRALYKLLAMLNDRGRWNLLVEDEKTRSIALAKISKMHVALSTRPFPVKGHFGKKNCERTVKFSLSMRIR